jgi:hypothetical protein
MVSPQFLSSALRDRGKALRGVKYLLLVFMPLFGAYRESCSRFGSKKAGSIPAPGSSNPRAQDNVPNSIARSGARVFQGAKPLDQSFGRINYSPDSIVKAF